MSHYIHQSKHNNVLHVQTGRQSTYLASIYLSTSKFFAIYRGNGKKKEKKNTLKFTELSSKICIIKEILWAKKPDIAAFLQTD